MPTASSPLVPPGRPSLTPSERQTLLRLARRAVTAAAQGMRWTVPEATVLTPRLQQPQGCFVTLRVRAALRGCLGNVIARGPLYEGVLENAHAAAKRDPRFAPIAVSEVPEVEIEVSVLSEPQALSFASPQELVQKLEPHRHGVVLQMGARSATFLPQVWEQIPEPERFLAHLSRKAGCGTADWRQSGTLVLVYEAECFCESALGHSATDETRTDPPGSE